MQRRLVDVGDVHRHLRNLILVDIPSDGLGALEGTRLHDDVTVLVLLGRAGDGISLADGASLFAHVKRDGIGAAGRCGVEVEVGGDKEVACSDGSTTCAGHLLVERTGTEVGLLAWGREFLGQCLILALTADCQVAALGGESGSLIAVARYARLVGDALG